MTRVSAILSSLLLCVGVSRFGIAPASADSSIRTSSENVSPPADALALALESVRCAQSAGHGRKASRLALIDYRVPSLQERLWIIDLATGRIVFRDHVAHGRGTGENLAQHFSNKPGSHQSSLGLFLTNEIYQGRNGYSLRMDGLEPGVNDQARERAIVMHGASYVDPIGGKTRGRLGRSWGCPAVRTEVAHPIIDALAGGQFLFAYYPDETWVSSSRFLQCDDRVARRERGS
ncbi:MAG: murein L,D-transpeptidase catalytic domain family protein [Deltaproteobacteria bacterium]|nr:murein L,D-transpeptidase catalytic domain family protein [Deltaproteobacteria bacterium]